MNKKGQYGKRLLQMFTEEEMELLTGKGDDWAFIPQAIGDWAGAMFASTNVTVIPFEDAMNVLGMMARAVYIMGYKRGKREAVMGMEWRVRDERGKRV